MAKKKSDNTQRLRLELYCRKCEEKFGANKIIRECPFCKSNQITVSDTVTLESQRLGL